VFKPGGVLAARGNEGVYRPGAGDGLKNSVMFTWGFLEMVCWFWVSDCFQGVVRGGNAGRKLHSIADGFGIDLCYVEG